MKSRTRRGPYNPKPRPSKQNKIYFVSTMLKEYRREETLDKNQPLQNDSSCTTTVVNSSITPVDLRDETLYESQQLKLSDPCVATIVSSSFDSAEFRDVIFDWDGMLDEFFASTGGNSPPELGEGKLLDVDTSHTSSEFENGSLDLDQLLRECISECISGLSSDDEVRQRSEE